MAIYHQVAPIVRKQMEDAFGELNAKQVWAIVNFAKMVRRSCRSNAAFNPAAELVFAGFTFQQYNTGKMSRKNKPIMGLRITAPDKTVVSDESEEDDE